VTIPSKHLPKLNSTDPARENAPWSPARENIPRAQQLMLSGATEVRQQPQGHAQNINYRGARNSIAKFLKINRGCENATRCSKGNLGLERKPRSNLKNLCAANRKIDAVPEQPSDSEARLAVKI